LSTTFFHSVICGRLPPSSPGFVRVSSPQPAPARRVQPRRDAAERFFIASFRGDFWEWPYDCGSVVRYRISGAGPGDNVADAAWRDLSDRRPVSPGRRFPEDRS
jgi:hypothetical protein